MASSSGPYAADLERVEAALEAARAILDEFEPGRVAAIKKEGGDPLTAADTAVDEALKRVLPRRGEGWLSEETTDDPARLDCRRAWIVDPLDGTKEFVLGIPEWCVSIGLVEDGRAVAGGVLNPVTDELILGATGHGVTVNGEPAGLVNKPGLDGLEVLASNSEIKRGEWDGYEDAPFTVKPCGSVAYKLGLVACGRGDVTWTLVPKNEWDVAAGIALVKAAGGVACLPDGAERALNQRDPLLPGFFAGTRSAFEAFRNLPVVK